MATGSPMLFSELPIAAATGLARRLGQAHTWVDRRERGMWRARVSPPFAVRRVPAV